jgi:predicted amino acid racemase
LTTYPRLTISCDTVAANTRVLAERLRAQGIALIGVTKAVDGEPAVGRALLGAGCTGLADSRLPALERLAAHRLAPLTLIRAPEYAEIAAAALIADRVLLSDAATARRLGEHAQSERRGGSAQSAPIEILLTVDLGDRREGVLPEQAAAVAADIAAAPGVALAGIAVNFACLSGQLPSIDLFRQAESVLDDIAPLCADMPTLSLGGTCCVQCLDGYVPRHHSELRSGGGPLYGYDFVSAAPIAGLRRTDPVFTASVLECYRKPPAPAGAKGRDAFGHVPDVSLPERDAWYALLACGRRDCQPEGLTPLVPGSYVAGMTSDVTVLIVEQPLAVGDTVAFTVDYDGLVRAMTSPFVTKEFTASSNKEDTRRPKRDDAPETAEGSS